MPFVIPLRNDKKWPLPISPPAACILLIMRKAKGEIERLAKHERACNADPQPDDRALAHVENAVGAGDVFVDPAFDDLKKSTEIAKRMVVSYGMSDEVGPGEAG